MRKILLEFKRAATPEQVQEYLAFQLGFPGYYGREPEEENPHLCVVFADLEENYGENEGPGL